MGLYRFCQLQFNIIQNTMYFHQSQVCGVYLKDLWIVSRSNTWADLHFMCITWYRIIKAFIFKALRFKHKKNSEHKNVNIFRVLWIWPSSMHTAEGFESFYNTPPTHTHKITIFYDIIMYLVKMLSLYVDMISMVKRKSNHWKILSQIPQVD